MTSQKKALWVVFKPKEPVSTARMREQFLGSYPVFKDMPGLFSKCWWCNEEKGEWGALYIFYSEAALNEYLKSDRWLKTVPEKYGIRPETVVILDPGPILCKETITEEENSWISP